MLITNYQTRFQSIEHKKKDMLFRRNETKRKLMKTV